MILLSFIFGLLIGSFLNALIYRLHHKHGIVFQRSFCPQCRKQLTWRELIPLVSFFAQLGKCRGCRKKISWQYPIVELATGVLFALAYYHVGRQCQLSPVLFNCYIVQLLSQWFFISVLTVIFVYDLRWQLILDKITLPAIGIGILFGVINVFVSGASLAGWLVNSSIAIAIGGGFFLLQFLISKGTWIGGGDIRLGALMGVILGFPNVIWALVLAYLAGAIVAVVLLSTGRKKWSSQVPFGTFLSLATVAVFYWGDKIINWYWNLFSFNL
jgi:prepilin signal peptidase PulO-like enzyme (type II secretory pathway)